MSVYCTTYCNHGHDTANGFPVDHECYVLPPAALAAEQAGDYERAQALIASAKPLQTFDASKPRKPRKRPMTVFERDLRAAFERTVLPENIDTALAIIAGKRDAHDYLYASGRIEAWHLRLPKYAAALRALDMLLGTCGVESLGGKSDDPAHTGAPFEYLNTGDGYAPTVVWYRSSGRFYIRCWASIVEAYRLK